ncbi:MAG: LysM peptidoglycan-binding domain-containing protein [Patescibacteria group bacterium]
MATYIVRAGDSLSAIATRSGVTLRELVQANPQITNINLIRIGQIITIPSKQPPAPTAIITPAQFHAIVPTLDVGRATELCEPLIATLQEFGLSTVARRAAFIAQAAHESAGFSTFIENLNYSAASLNRVWPSHFPLAIAALYNRQPERIANRAYANRIGNGNEASGDGWRYRGHGVFQLTGKANYAACSAALGLDLVSHPELLEQTTNAFRSAGWFWNSKALSPLADMGNFNEITRRINGGYNGIEDRVRYWNTAKIVLRG